MNQMVEVMNNLKLNIAEVTAINSHLNSAKFAQVDNEIMIWVVDLKLQLSKIEKEKESFIKKTVEEIKTDRFKELEVIENKTEEEQKEFENIIKSLDIKLNDILKIYLQKEVEINIQPITKENLMSFCKYNDYSMDVIEYLYNKFVETV